MLSIEQINKLLGVEESFHASYKLMEVLGSEEDRNNLFEEFLKLETNLYYDWFLNYYQSEHSDRKGKGQDFTPDEVSEIASRILRQGRSNLDICAGVGGLTIKRYADNPNQDFYCEEFSDRAIPFLLFNLAIRNIKGIVRHGDSLTRRFKAIYKLEKGDKFSSIEILDEIEDIKVETIIMNPPYSLKWSPDKKYLEENRFKEFGILAPNSKADYAFLLTGLDQLTENGKMAIILPHGVLFRGGSEGIIREKLIKLNYIESIIGLPGKVFYNTDIPTVILVLKKNKENKDILFIDASEEFKNAPPKNVIEERHINKILKIYQNNKEIDKFSKLIKFDEIKENDFNLNIPRYIDKYVEEYVPPLADILKDLIKLDEEIEAKQLEFANTVGQLTSKSIEKDRELSNFAKYLKNRGTTKRKGQISFYD
ncbi:N-6 DNA methylase [Tissierella creatinophila]|uniref:site-specific DNA-methyltransferase (adenine-specific) n=1 Tax=Tissierella creatinophila DSM 6911 TaxID=1123403 RepID=A0A1U7M4N5_TISCR|nr:N-6 DNA methylase [Tissierella creatinophila]OLS02245.1 putative type I restriction enzymeP M protein [Tissierella creatinophila DSM 6911]